MPNTPDADSPLDAEITAPKDPSAPSNEAVFRVIRMYLKDCSVEQPNAPEIFSDARGPDIQISVNSASVKVGDGLYEIAIRAGINARIEKKVLFFINLEQAALFEIRNVPEDQLAPNLAINCHQIVYDALKENMADLIRRSGFEPVELKEVDFLANYENSLKRQAE